VAAPIPIPDPVIKTVGFSVFSIEIPCPQGDHPR
jgi:hypothetical protein